MVVQLKLDKEKSLKPLKTIIFLSISIFKGEIKMLRNKKTFGRSIRFVNRHERNVLGWDVI
jgi:hypothetical protein